jgi:hypothetical protein
VAASAMVDIGGDWKVSARGRRCDNANALKGDLISSDRVKLNGRAQSCDDKSREDGITWLHERRFVWSASFPHGLIPLETP